MSLQSRFKKPSAVVTLPSKPVSGVHSEKHYKVPELAKLWGFSDDFIRSLFENEIGVLKIVRPEDPDKKRTDCPKTRPNCKGKREYVSLRIPESVAARVHERLHGKKVA
jgi:hypothetical protein